MKPWRFVTCTKKEKHSGNQSKIKISLDKERRDFLHRKLPQNTEMRWFLVYYIQYHAFLPDVQT